MKHLTDQELLARTKAIAAEERRITLSLIEHLEEVQRRMLYAQLNYSSLWEFARRELGLSEGSAQRRISAMRLVRDVPDAKAALASGELTLTNASKLQSFRKAARKAGKQMDVGALIKQVAHLSQTECDQKLFEILPEAIPRERERVVSSAGDRELKIVVSAQLYEKLQRLKGLLAHSLGDPTYEALLERIASEALVLLEKKKGIVVDPTPSKRAPKRSAARNELAVPAGAVDAHAASTAAAAVNLGPSAPTAAPETKSASSAPFNKAVQQKTLPPGVRVAIPAAWKRAVWSRAKGRCEITSPDGRRCSSRYRLEIDHRIPLALGGENAPSNLRLACWHHNQQLARAHGLRV